MLPLSTYLDRRHNTLLETLGDVAGGEVCPEVDGVGRLVAVFIIVFFIRERIDRPSRSPIGEAHPASPSARAGQLSELLWQKSISFVSRFLRS